LMLLKFLEYSSLVFRPQILHFCQMLLFFQ
jgi:hypothetical protein